MLTEAYPADTLENVTYTYDNTTTPAGNKGRGQLTRIADQSGSTAYVYNALGQIITDTRVIATKTYVTRYLYNARGLVTQITYPSGRIVSIARNSLGQVTAVTTKQTAASTTTVNVATGLTYAPMSNLLTAMTHGNSLVSTAGYDLDYRLSSLNVKDGAASVSALAYAYTDLVNLTGITDGVTAANSNTLGYSLANRLNAASGAWGSKSFGYDGVGNRLIDNTTLSGTTTNRTQYYGTTNNRLGSIYENGAQLRSYTYDNAGNIITETRPGESFAYTYNKRNRLSAVTRNSVAYATYGYNALEQLTTRTTTAAGGPVGQVAYTYDLDGHLMTEATASTGAKTREYIWLPGNDNTPIDLPLAVIDVAANTVSYVHADHLGRPIRMTSTAKATVWQATWKPWGEVQTLSGTNSNNLRYPGQYFQIETGQHYNHHRMYDPVTGRYTQPDPLGFVDGPSVYAYAKNSPYMRVDRTGKETTIVIWPDNFVGQHASVYISDNHGPFSNGSGNAAYDPGSGLACSCGKGQDFAWGEDVVSFEKFTTPTESDNNPIFYTFNTSPSEEAAIIQNIKDIGAAFGAGFCASGVDAVIRGNGPFKQLPWYPWNSPHGLGSSLSNLGVPYSSQAPGNGPGPYSDKAK